MAYEQQMMIQPEQQQLPMDLGQNRPTMMQQSPDQSELVRWQQNFHEVREEIIHRLRGDDYDFRTQKWIGNPNKRMSNEKGINAIILKINQCVNKFFIMGNLKEEMVHKITWHADLVMIPLLVVEYDEYLIDPQNLPFIWDMIDNSIFMGLSRAIGQGERIWLSKIITHSINESSALQGGGQKKGGLLSFFGFGKK